MRIIDGEPGFRTFRRLARDSFVALPGDSSMRSTRTAEWLVPARADACGLLEDTRAAKRLFVVGGEEIRAAHLSAFAFANARAGAEVVLHACSRARESDVPFLFVAVPRAESATLVDALARRLDRARIVEAPATIYGFGLDSGHDWRIHTAEI